MSNASVLRDLHRPGAPLVLPNVWDCRSACLVAAAGLPAVATSSAAIADSLGYRDGEDTPPGEMFAAIARIARVVDVPVTADVERGYGLPAAELVEHLAAAGAVGCNLEDSDPRTLLDADLQAKFLADVRAAAHALGIDLVINARIDTYLPGRAALGRAESGAAQPENAEASAVEPGRAELGDGKPRDRLAETVRRAQLYRDAGADCVYPILMHDEHEIADLTAAVDAPVNILAGLGRTVPELAELGVARISFGASLYQATNAHLANLIAGYAPVAR